MNQRAFVLRLEAITAHFRDPRLNTAKIGLPSRTLLAPPPSTVHGLICAAAGGWVEPETLVLGWRTDFASIGIDFGRNQLPQRGEFNSKLGLQKTSPSPIEREFLAFPTLSLLVMNDCIDKNWFRAPANPLSLGRSEDMIVETFCERDTEFELREEGEIARQCLPMSLGSGTVYAAPLYFETKRRPIGMAPRVDAASRQNVQSRSSKDQFAFLPHTGETFYLWDFADVTR